MFIDDTPGSSIMQMRQKARRMAQKSKELGVIIVDYLQLISGNPRMERHNQIAEISRFLKQLARDLEVPVIALSQLSRAVERRTGSHRPQLSDLRESGAIEQDADLVLFIYRESVYLRNRGDGEDSEKYIESKNKAEIIIGKQRNGPVGSIDISFIDKYASFQNLDTVHSKEVLDF
jgi:replicative DNA helicase